MGQMNIGCNCGKCGKKIIASVKEDRRPVMSTLWCNDCAAPELLEALKRALPRVEQERLTLLQARLPEAAICLIDKEIRSIKAAIAKAEGE